MTDEKPLLSSFVANKLYYSNKKMQHNKFDKTIKVCDYETEITRPS